MLFNSYAFLFVFLPLALLGYAIAGRFGRRAVIGWLGFASLAFYSYWRPVYVVVLLGSIALNFAAAALISRKVPNSVPTKIWLTLAIALDLLVLGYCKYLFPLLNFASSLTGSARHWANIALPLGISFFTFTQIAYLVDLQQGEAIPESFSNYVLFVTFFPHLIAGPILHHSEIMPQFRQERRYQLNTGDLAVGFSWFVMGLGKKVLLADTFAKNADAFYATAGPVPALAVLRGLLSYALQLYFDFSGYSDMAMGLARMFSIDFPLNFSSPYKATNILDYWQRWHMTLTRYLNVYLFNPVSMHMTRKRMQQGKKANRKAQRTLGGFWQLIAVPVLVTMFLAGIWHGAGLQFLVFGMAHAFFMIVNHAWRAFVPEDSPWQKLLPTPVCVAITFGCAIFAQIFFRSANCTQALHILAELAGAHGIGTFALGGENKLLVLQSLLQIAGGLVIIWAMPNTQQILSRFHPSFELSPFDKQSTWLKLQWAPTTFWAIVIGVLFLSSTVGMQDPSTFLYFQF